MFDPYTDFHSFTKVYFSEDGTVRQRQSKETSILWSHHEETRELPGERDNARNNARCTQVRKTTHGLDGQHQDVDRTPRGRVNQKDRGQRKMEKVRPWCGQPSDQGRLKNTAEVRLLSMKFGHLEPTIYS